eukprot:Polyplicarium_translucidae@DN3370_c0_g1_i4.p1
MEVHRRQPRGGPCRHSRSRSRDGGRPGHGHDAGRAPFRALPYKRREDRRFRSHDSTFDSRLGPIRREDRVPRRRREDEAQFGQYSSLPPQFADRDARDAPASFPCRHRSPSPVTQSPRRRENRSAPRWRSPPSAHRSLSPHGEGTEGPPPIPRPATSRSASPPHRPRTPPLSPDTLDTGPVSVELSAVPRHLNSVAHLAEFWGKCGEVTNVAVNQQRGSALLTFSTLRAAHKATQIAHWDENRIHVAIVRPLPMRPRFAPPPPTVMAPMLPPVLGPRAYPVGPPPSQMIPLPCPAWHPPPGVMAPLRHVRMSMGHVPVIPMAQFPEAPPIAVAPPPRPPPENPPKERKTPPLVQRKKALLVQYSEFLKGLVGNLNDKSRSEASRASILKMTEVVKARIANLSKPAQTIVDELRMQKQLNRLMIQAQSDPSLPQMESRTSLRKEDTTPHKLDNRPTSLIFTDLPVHQDDFPRHFVDTPKFNARMTTTLLRLPIAKLDRSDASFELQKFIDSVNEKRGAPGQSKDEEVATPAVAPPTREKVTVQTLIWIAQYECRWAAEQVFHRQKLLCTTAWWGPKHVRIPKAVSTTEDPRDSEKRSREVTTEGRDRDVERIEFERSDDEGTPASEASGDGYLPALSDDDEYDREVKAWRTR